MQTNYNGCGDGDGAMMCTEAKPKTCTITRCGPLQSSVAAGDLVEFCENLSQKQKIEQEQKAKCRQPGEYDPCQNPCARIPGQHPFCPPGQTVGILPKSYVEDIPRSLNKPTSGPPPRLPWKQCIENVLVNDQVRRPMARWCHLRPIPPIVIPCSEIDRMKNQIAERGRLKQECLDAAAEREAARQASYQRHSEWNYTVDSLIARKRKEQVDKEKAEEKEFQKLSELIKKGRDEHSKQMQDRAKEQLLHRKGLIRDFHAAMAYSKALKDEKDLRTSQFSRPVCKFKEEKCPEDQSPVMSDPCWKRVDLENHRPEYVKKEAKNECSKDRLNILKCDEDRVPERKAELEKEKEKLKSLRYECPLPWPDSYIKYIEEPPCEVEDNNKCKKQRQLSDDYFLEIHDKLAADAFVEYHEKEIDRQACEYNEYKRKVDRMRKEKEQKLIEEKVQRAIKNSEIAGRMWVEAKNKQKKRADEYTRLKEIWEAEHAKKENMMKSRRQALEEEIAQDFLCRKDNALVKRLELDATRDWEKSCCLAAQDAERQCVFENTRREKAKELQKYHLEQMASRVQREEDERFLNAAYGEKTRINYACELNELKEYANEQIKQWKAKGRPIYPMIHAMKKWDYDAGMTPELYARTPLCPGACGDGKPKYACAEEDPDFESTGQRLGFCDNGEGQWKPSGPDRRSNSNNNNNCSENTKDGKEPPSPADCQSPKEKST